MSTHDDPDYKVGYGKPPETTRFKKGRSGNPKGRPKGAKGVQASLKRELESKITVQEGNRTIRITKAEAMAKQLMNKALTGDIKAMMALLKLDPELYGSVIEQLEAETPSGNQCPEAVDYDILRDFFASSDDKDHNDSVEDLNAGNPIDETDDDGTVEDWEVDCWNFDDGGQDDDIT